MRIIFLSIVCLTYCFNANAVSFKQAQIILDVHSDATFEEVAGAYRDKAKQFHLKDDTDYMNNFNKAFDILSFKLGREKEITVRKNPFVKKWNLEPFLVGRSHLLSLFQNYVTEIEKVLNSTEDVVAVHKQFKASTSEVSDAFDSLLLQILTRERNIRKYPVDQILLKILENEPSDLFYESIFSLPFFSKKNMEAFPKSTFKILNQLIVAEDQKRLNMLMENYYSRTSYKLINCSDIF